MRQQPKRRVPGKLRPALVGLMTAILLIPVPVYALNLSTLNWNLPSSAQGPFFQVQQTTSTETNSVLTFALQPTTDFGGTITQSATVMATFFNIPGTELNATWSGLSGLQGTGTVEISIMTSGMPSNMFSQSATSQPPDEPTITGSDLAGMPYFEVAISVKFTFVNFSQSTGSTSFTLDFHN